MPTIISGTTGVDSVGNTAGRGPAFSATSAAAVAFSLSTVTKIILPTEVFDTSSARFSAVLVRAI